MFHIAHVNKVNHDQAPQVTQTELAGDLLGCFHVGLERRLLNTFFLGSTTRVDINRHQRFRGVDDNGTARFQFDLLAVDRLELFFELVARKQRLLVAIELHPALIARHHGLEEVAGAVIDLAVIDEHFLNIGGEIIPDGANDEIVFLVDQGQCR